jgi:phage protein D
MPVLTESFKVEIEGAEIDDVYEQLTSLEVELDEELPAMWRLRLPLLLQKDGTWALLDDERFRVWNSVVVSAGLDGDMQELITGYVTHVRPVFEADVTQCELEVWGLDGSVLLDREDKLKDWPNKKDSDIATEIYSAYGLSPEVEDTEVVHDEAVSTVIQRETDWQFLNRLALRNGYECFVEGTTGFFRKPPVDASPQALLAVQFGDETNVNRFELEINALTPANVSMFQVDRVNKEVLDVTADSSDQKALGATGAADIVAAGVDPGLVVVGQTMTTGSAEMTGLCRGLFHQQEWFVTGEGEIAANVSGALLKPRGTVTIKGVGEQFSGVYFVSHVTHSFTGDGYTQTFEVKRNGLMPTGSEDFSGGNGGLLGGLV